MSKKLTQEEFISRCYSIYGDKYDFSKTIYTGNRNKIIVICPIHGEFEIISANVICNNKKNLCIKCFRESQLTSNVKFIEKVKNIHGDKFDYDNCHYRGLKKKVYITCKLHGDFSIFSSYLLFGGDCPTCLHEKEHKCVSEFVEKAIKLHGDKYDYSLVKYTSSLNKVNIICPIHGIFEQTPTRHLGGSGCYKCTILKRTKTPDTFIDQCREKHGGKYDYSLVEYKNLKTKVKIICNKHGIFEQNAKTHLNGGGCYKCKSSKGENKIRYYLQENNIVFEEQKKFKDCKYIRVLPFDFYLPEYQVCIEFDGIQHHEPISFSSDSSHETKQNNLETIQLKDIIKTEYCLNNNIKLIRIPYWDKYKIEEILKKENL